jgi:ATP-dependent DNA ligase
MYFFKQNKKAISFVSINKINDISFLVVKATTYSKFSRINTYEVHKFDNSTLMNKAYNSFISKQRLYDQPDMNTSLIKPMLLESCDKNKITYPVYVQRKYDGIRCIAHFINNELVLQSRDGILYNIPHIKESLKLLMTKININKFDGELYNHEIGLHKIASCVKTGDKNKLINYVIYDLPYSNLEMFKRTNYLTTIDSIIKEYGIKYLQVDCGNLVHNEEELKEYHMKSLELNYEGTIVCKYNGFYDEGLRTDSKTKIKPRQTSEFKCVGHYYNKGKYSKQSTLICVTDQGKEFHVKMKGTNKEREEMAANFETDFLNKMITVEYRVLSKEGKPIEAVGIAVRDYE